MPTDPHIHVSIAPGSPPEKYVLMAKHLLRLSGQYPEVLDLLKADGTLRRRLVGRTQEHEATEPLSEPWLEELWQEFDAWGRRWPMILADVMELQVNGSPAMPLLAKATSENTRWVFPWPSQQWDKFSQVLNAFSGYIVRWVTGTQREREPRPDEGMLPSRLHDMFRRVTIEAMSHERVQRLPLRHPEQVVLTDIEQAAIEYARRHAGARLRPLFTRLGAQLEQRALDAERQAVRTRLPEALRQRAGVPKLAALLAEAAQSWDRDWQRVARTELQDAWHNGVVATMLAHPIPGQPETPPAQRFVYRMPSAAACQVCLRLFLMPDGSPRLFTLQELLDNGTNEGRTAAEALPVISVVHPQCVCSSPMEYHPVIEPVFQKMRETWATQH